jgi:hypothetical protein
MAASQTSNVSTLCAVAARPGRPRSHLRAYLISPDSAVSVSRHLRGLYAEANPGWFCCRQTAALRTIDLVSTLSIRLARRCAQVNMLRCAAARAIWKRLRT